MEKACFDGDVAAARKCLDSIKKMPGSLHVIHRSLLLSIQSGQLSTFVLLLDATGKSLISRPGIRQICQLEDRVEFLEALLQRGWDPNQRHGGATALYDALKSPQNTRWLLDHHADPNCPPLETASIDLLGAAAAKSPPEVVRLLLDHGAEVRGTQAVHMAAKFSANLVAVGGGDEVHEVLKPDPTRVEILRMLLDAGADMNEMEPDPKGPGALRGNNHQRTPWTGTPLHHAVQSGSVAAVELLLSRGADLTAPSWSGHSAVQAAEKAGRQDIIEALARHKMP